MADLMEPDARTRRWAKESLAALLQMPEDSNEIEPILEHILAHDDPDDLKETLVGFAEAAAVHKVYNFVEDLFARRRGKGKGKGKFDGPEDVDKGSAKGQGKAQQAENSAKKAAKPRQADTKKEAAQPKLDMPMLPREIGDKRMMVIDAASGRHKALTNCLNCGKVITESEGWGPCLFCGNPLDVGDQYGTRSGDDRGFMESVGKAPSTEESAYHEKFNNAFERAVATKNRLLSYDRDAKKRTKVYDDATDWYSESVNPWLSQRQREEAVQKGKEEERKQREEKRKIHAKIDLVGRTVISTDADVNEEMKKANKENFEAWNEQVADEIRLRSMYQQEQGVGANNHLSEDSKQLYDRLRSAVQSSNKTFQAAAAGADAESTKASKSRWEAVGTERVEDEILTVTEGAFATSSEPSRKLLPAEESPYGNDDDTGQCLTMWQPWASLLVHGFKRAEGRSWRSNHRGRLWIHAASRQPDSMEIQELEAKYKSLYESFGVPTPAMPSESGGYPTSALLGCVDVEACWDKDEYQKILDATPGMPPEENGSEFIFWCLRPRRLVIPIKMGGDNKIWTIARSQLQAAQRGLQQVRWPAPEPGQASLVSPVLPERKIEASAASNAPATQGSGGSSSEPKATSKRGGKAAQAAGDSKLGSSEAQSASRQLPEAAAPRLDLWPADQGEDLVVVSKDKDCMDRDIVILQDGFVQLCGFVPLDVQERIVGLMRDVGISESGFFAEPDDSLKVSKDFSRMYLGLHWNAVAATWESVRSNINGAPVAPIPKDLLDLYSAALGRANREINNPRNKKRKLQPFPDGKPGLAVVDFMPPSSGMQLHQDTQESQQSIAAGSPVLGICIGDACEFSYTMDTPNAGSGQKPKVVRMDSGDVYLFGGTSRLLWHGISRVIPRTAPPTLRLQPGRLSVTLKVP